MRSLSRATVLLLVLCALPAMAGPVTLLSKADPDRPSGTAGGASEVAAISADGRYVALLSNADNLLPGVTDTNTGKDVFLHDRIAGTTVLVSHAAGDLSTAGNGEAVSADLSADGRWVAFGSLATDLAAGQMDGDLTADLFLWDRDTGVTILVSHRPGLPTTAAGGFVHRPALSADGGRIAFGSSAPDLVAGQTDGSSVDVFLYDRATATNVLVSHMSGNATDAAGGVSQPVLSADGNWVVFGSTSPDLVTGQVDPSGSEDLFLYDRATGTNVLVSHAAGLPSTAADQFSAAPQISADGGWIAYHSYASNLAAGQIDNNGGYPFGPDVFLYDRAAGTSTLVSHTLSSATTTGNHYSERPTLTADGRYVAFMGESTDLVAESTGLWQATFVYDRVSGINTLVRGATTPGGDSILPQISADGTRVAFLGNDSHLVPGQTDTFYTWDVFLWSRVSGAVLLVTRTSGSATTATGDSFTWDLRLSADGSWLALSSSSSKLVDDDHNAADDAFLFGQVTGMNTLLTPRGGAISASAGGAIADQVARAMSNDGRFTAFTSAASNLPGVSDGNHASDVFFYDRVTNAITLVSHASGFATTTADAASAAPRVSADGTFIAFASQASNLGPDQLPPPPPFSSPSQLYCYDRSDGTVSLISHQIGLPTTPADDSLFDYSLSGDGRWIAFSHSGSNLVAGQMGGSGALNVFLYDRSTDASVLVSHSIASPQQRGDSNSFTPAVSREGRYVAFASYASDLVPGQFDNRLRIYLYDRLTGGNVLVGSDLDGSFALSDDGRWVVFTNSVGNVVPGQVDLNGGADVYLWDRVSGSTQLVSRTPASPVTAGNGVSSLGSPTVGSAENVPVLSADGRWVVFTSSATDLVGGQTGPPGGIFLFDRISGTVTLVSRTAASPTANGNGRSSEPAISADGRFVAYLSEATDLVPGQIDQDSDADLFLYDRISGTTALVSHIPSSDITSGRLGSELVRLSADGTWIAFSSRSPDLVADDHNGTVDAFLYANPLGRDFFTLPPCRLLDTRLAGPALSSGVKRTWVAPGLCGIPAAARVIAANVTVVQPTGGGYLTFYPGDTAAGTTSTINFAPGLTRANNAILPLAFDGTGTFAVAPFVAGDGAVHLIVDVNGYFD